MQSSVFKEWVNGLPVNKASFGELRKQEDKFRALVLRHGISNPDIAREAMTNLRVVEARLDRLAISGCDESLSFLYERKGLMFNPAQQRWTSM